ncbi:hypothetical protein OV760_28550, partial [Salmonella enterica subsp. enterica serovar 1,4,[5],12:i:-]|nr:hypothetical protein [Salmonella enterica subsp. enterica serovar 1,4,[5],12:i:-]
MKSSNYMSKGAAGFPGSANYLAQGAGGFAGPMFTTAMHSMHMRPMMPPQPLPPMAPATPEMMIDMDNSTTEENPWYSQVSWLNKNMTSADGLYLIPPAALNTS